MSSRFYNILEAGIFLKSNELIGYFLSLVSRAHIRLDAAPDCASSLIWALDMRLKKEQLSSLL